MALACGMNSLPFSQTRTEVILERMEEKFPDKPLHSDEFCTSLAEEVQTKATQYGYAKPDEREEKRRFARRESLMTNDSFWCCVLMSVI